MKARLVLEAARRKLVELDWIQGSYQKAMGKQLHFEGPTTEIWDEKAGEYRNIPISKTEAVCAMGAVELALSGKVDLGEETVSSYMDLDIYKEVNNLLRSAIENDLPTFESLDSESQRFYRENYDAYVEDLRTYSPRTPVPFEEYTREHIWDDYSIENDGVEDWNDKGGRTKEEVVAAFDRAIELARAKELVPA